ncbi:hypothetical protein JCM5353_002651 [Sporobolomyces roseus]
MAPRRNTSINLGGPSPRSSQATPTQEEMDPSIVAEMVARHKARLKRQREKKQQLVIEQAKLASESYKESVKKVLAEGEKKKGEVIKRHQIEEQKLKDELAQVEGELIAMIQSDTSESKLVSASIVSAIEQNENVKATMVEHLAKISKDEEKSAEAGLAELWLTDEEEEGQIDDQEQGAWSA